MHRTILKWVLDTLVGAWGSELGKGREGSQLRGSWSRFPPWAIRASVHWGRVSESTEQSCKWFQLKGKGPEVFMHHLPSVCGGGLFPPPAWYPEKALQRMLAGGSCRIGSHKNSEHQGETERASVTPSKLDISKHWEKIISEGRMINKDHRTEDLKCQVREFLTLSYRHLGAT